MMAGKSEQLCSVDIRNYNKQREEQRIFKISSDNSAYNENRWRTSTQDAFCKPDVQKPLVDGRRKDLIKRNLNERILEKIIYDMNRKEVFEEAEKPSEYIDNFCDPNFTPFMDQPDNEVHKLMKYSLYACNNQSLYKERIDRGELKARSEIANLNEPFRRNCSFTTAPEVAFREPTGGY